jgi:hypothetical protein
MNLQNIISEIEKADPEIYDRLDTRRKAMKKFTSFSGKVALASLPLAFGSMLNTAYAKTSSLNDLVTDTLNFALKLEYLEAEFYTKVVGSPGYLTASASDQAALTKIRNDENLHVAFLKGALGASAIAKPNIDLTGGGSAAGTGPFAGYLASYPVQLAMAQTFEDTGVRAYKGQAPNLQSSRPYLTAALEIHSVEARHASKVRMMRRTANTLIPAGQVVKSWITLNQSGIDTGNAGTNAAIQKSYDGATPESTTTQAGVNIIGIGGNAFIDSKAASEAFDEPLTTAEVLAIVAGFFY